MNDKISQYSICIFDGREITPLKYITKEQYTFLKDDCDIVKMYYSQYLVFATLKLNFEKVKNLYEDGYVKAGEINLRVLSGSAILLQSNRLIMNLLASFKFYIDHAHMFVNRNFGEVENNKLKVYCSSIYDSNFSYRILSKLRNFSIHMGFILDPPNFEVEDSEKHPAERLGRIKYYVNKHRLLKEKGFLGRIVENDLTNLQQDRIEIMPLIIELETLIDKIQNYILKPHIGILNQKLEIIMKFCNINIDETYDILVKMDIKDKTSEFLTYPIPTIAIEDLNGFINN